MVQTFFYSRIYILRRCYILIQQITGLLSDRAEYPVYHKSVDFFFHQNRCFINGSGKFHQRINRLIRYMRPPYNLHKLHHKGRIEKMKIGHLFRSFNRICKQGAYNIGTVTRVNGMLRCVLVCLAQNLSFNGQNIRNSLYHKICARSRFFQAIGKYKAPLRFDRFLLVHLSFFYPGSEPVPCKCLCFSNHILIQIIICNPISAQSALYGNLVPHCAASEYGHIFNLHLNLP